MKLNYSYTHFLALAVLLTLAVGTAMGQTEDQKNGFGVFYGNHKYAGSAGNEYTSFSNSDFMAGMQYARYLSNTFDVGLAFSFARLDYYNANYNGRSYIYMNEIYNGNAHIRVKLLREEAPLRPYLLAGVGVNYNDVLLGRNDANTRAKFTTPNIPLGAGFKFRLDDHITFDFETTWNKVLGNFDHENSGSGNDAFMFHTIGFTYNVGPKPADTDGDGITDNQDRCPDTPAGVRVDDFGCPLDSDGDDVPNYLDRCPTVPGLETYDGCPDRDGDGIEDAFDMCPDVPGVAEFFGCSDRDGDGIPDSEDKCPDVAGLCQFDGCPDRDGDGVPDVDDQCPDEPGSIANNGCPEIRKDDLDAINRALENVYFDFDTYEINAPSVASLNKIVNILSENPSYHVLIEAHADNIGSDTHNRTLSGRRGEAVMNYLVSNGIGGARISSQAYGDARPVATNNTAEGRALNRRVTFIIRL